MIKDGANLDVAMKAWREGDSAFHAAANNNNYQIVELLLDTGANVNITKKAGVSPMFTPDRNLMLCGGCNKIGYCDRVCCQKKDWKQGEHKAKCAAIAAEAPLLKAVGDEDGISGMGMKLDIGSGKKKKGKGKRRTQTK